MKFCALCGKKILKEKPTIEHVYPKCIYKWTKDYLNEEEYKKVYDLIENNESNILDAHYGCNCKKRSSMPNIDNLYVSKEKKHSLILLGNKLKKYIDLYGNLMEKVLVKQDYKCKYCNKKLTNDNLVPRRINHDANRTIENCQLICNECMDKHETRKRPDSNKVMPSNFKIKN